MSQAQADTPDGRESTGSAMQRPRERSRASRYVAALLFVATAIVARRLLAPILGDRHPFSTFYISVTAAAWWGGLGPTLFAMVLGYLAADWFFIAPRNAFSTLNLADTGTYGFVGLAIAIFNGVMRRAQDRAEASASDARNRQEKLEREITERRRIEAERVRLFEQLLATRTRLEAVLRQMPAGVLIAEAPSGRVVLANEQMHRIWRQPSSSRDGEPEYDVGEFRARDGRPYLAHEWPLARSLARGEVVQDEEVRFPTGSSQWGTALASSAPIHDTTGAIVAAVAILYDITAKKQAEEALLRAHAELEGRVAERTADLARANESLRTEVAERRLAQRARDELLKRLVVVQEEERVRIARELHDQMGQQLTALKLGLESLDRSAADDRGRDDQLRRMLILTRQIGHDMHRIAWELGPAALEELDLPNALSSYAEEWSGHFAIPAQFQSSGRWQERLSPQVETTLYRVVQEALTNVAKHAGASHVGLILNRLEDEVLVVVEDDGVGFDPEADAEQWRPGHRLGLVGMRERVQAVGGVLQVESNPGAGTTVFVRVPVLNENARWSDGQDAGAAGR